MTRTGKKLAVHVDEMNTAGGRMGRTKTRPMPKPQGEQQLSGSAWEQIVKAIRELTSPHTA